MLQFSSLGGVTSKSWRYINSVSWAINNDRLTCNWIHEIIYWSWTPSRVTSVLVHCVRIEMAEISPTSSPLLWHCPRLVSFRLLLWQRVFLSAHWSTRQSRQFASLGRSTMCCDRITLVSLANERCYRTPSECFVSHKNACVWTCVRILEYFDRADYSRFRSCMCLHKHEHNVRMNGSVHNVGYDSVILKSTTRKHFVPVMYPPICVAMLYSN